MYYAVMSSFVGEMQAEVLLSDTNPDRVEHLRQLRFFLTATFRSPTDLRINSGSTQWRSTTKNAINIVKRAQLAFMARIRFVSLFRQRFLTLFFSLGVRKVFEFHVCCYPTSLEQQAVPF